MNPTEQVLCATTARWLAATTAVFGALGLGAAAGAVTALEKLDAMSGGAGGAQWLSTHPAPRDRAARMRQQVA